MIDEFQEIISGVEKAKRKRSLKEVGVNITETA